MSTLLVLCPGSVPAAACGDRPTLTVLQGLIASQAARSGLRDHESTDLASSAGVSDAATCVGSPPKVDNRQYNGGRPRPVSETQADALFNFSKVLEGIATNIGPTQLEFRSQQLEGEQPRSLKRKAPLLAPRSRNVTLMVARPGYYNKHRAHMEWGVQVVLTVQGADGLAVCNVSGLAHLAGLLHCPLPPLLAAQTRWRAWVVRRATYRSNNGQTYHRGDKAYHDQGGLMLYGGHGEIKPHINEAGEVSITHSEVGNFWAVLNPAANAVANKHWDTCCQRDTDCVVITVGMHERWIMSSGNGDLLSALSLAHHFVEDGWEGVPSNGIYPATRDEVHLPEAAARWGSEFLSTVPAERSVTADALWAASEAMEANWGNDTMAAALHRSSGVGSPAEWKQQAAIWNAKLREKVRGEFEAAFPAQPQPGPADNAETPDASTSESLDLDSDDFEEVVNSWLSG